MKFNLNWLKDYLKTDCSAQEVCEKLNSIGLEVETSLPKVEDFDKIVVAEIVECEEHPNSDHLHVCKVSDGTNEYQIVCGAPNARKGIKVALALIGAYIPNGDFVIKKSKIRGVESCGMMCSKRELGLGIDHDGIIEIDDENVRLGQPYFRECKIFEDFPIEISITPNRGDAASVYGIARDLYAGGIGELKKPKSPVVEEKIENPFSVDVRADKCVFNCRYIKNVNASAKTPDFILKRLAINGINSNGIIVDILNYVMMSIGNPMHTYNADAIVGNKIIVDFAKDGEFESLQGKIKIDNDTLMVQDEQNNLCVAGIIGGENSKTKEDTKNVLLECAYFDPTITTIAGQKLKIVSDARFRYERGVDYENCILAMNLATEMVLRYCGGEASNIVSSGKKPESREIIYPLSLTKKLVGLDISTDETIKILKDLQFGVEQQTDDELLIKVPSFRSDVSIKEDITEELARIFGYDKIPSNELKISTNGNTSSFDDMLVLKKYLASNGMVELVNFSFTNKEKAQMFCENGKELNDNLEVLNPISSDLNFMRNTLLIGLLDAIVRNRSTVLENSLSYFEEGLFFTSPDKKGQHKSIAGVRFGSANSHDYFQEGRLFDIFDVKKDAFEILQLLGVAKTRLSVEKLEGFGYAHPTRSFKVCIKGEEVARFGEISPIVLKKFGIEEAVCFFEVFLDKLPEQKQQHTKVEINTLQPIIRDLNFVVDNSVSAEKLIKAYNNPLIENVLVVDVFKMVNKKSITLRYVIQPKEAMSNEQANEIQEKIIAEVKKACGGVLRNEYSEE